MPHSGSFMRALVLVWVSECEHIYIYLRERECVCVFGHMQVPFIKFRALFFTFASTEHVYFYAIFLLVWLVAWLFVAHCPVRSLLMFIWNSLVVNMLLCVCVSFCQQNFSIVFVHSILPCQRCFRFSTNISTNVRDYTNYTYMPFILFSFLFLFLYKNWQTNNC